MLVGGSKVQSRCKAGKTKKLEFLFLFCGKIKVLFWCRLFYRRS